VSKPTKSHKEVVVSVQEGKVSVYKNNKEVRTVHNELKGVILLPNQQAIFDRETDQYDKKLIGSPNIIHANEQAGFVFEETPLEEVIQRLEVAYGIEILFDEALLSRLPGDRPL
jgi:transmembrane sensor